jgi:hypothetical protein
MGMDMIFMDVKCEHGRISAVLSFEERLDNRARMDEDGRLLVLVQPIV